MSKLQDLINRLCPDGVPFKPLGELVMIKSAPKKLNKKMYKSHGNYPIIDQGQQQIIAYTDDSSAILPNDCYVLFGDHTKQIKYFDGQFAQGADGLKILKAVEELIPKFLFYYMQTLDIEDRGYNRHWVVVSPLLIPVPPMEVQEEIVKILDRFAVYTAELQARKDQYEYYRNLLLSFSPSAFGLGTDEEQKDNLVTIAPPSSYKFVWKPMGEICSKICSGGTPSTSNKSYYNGNIPWMRTQEVDWKDVFDTEMKITEDAVKNSSAKIIPANCVIIAMYGATAAKCCINKIPLTTNQACCNLQINPQIADYRYVYQWVCKEYEKLKALGEGSQSNINAAKIKNYRIPIPPLKVQEKIVAILDRFESLVNDLSKGLPAEIEATRLKYEYYRNKLLSFKKAI